MDDDGARTAPIFLDRAEGGTLFYRVALDPSELPPVRPRDLETAWHVAREAALLASDRTSPPPVRAFRFGGAAEGGGTDLVLADPDALTWAQALDARSRLTTRVGLSILLRLLGLVDLLAHASWTAPLCVFRRDGAALDPRLLAAAARLPLTSEGRLDETGMRAAASAAASR